MKWHDSRLSQPRYPFLHYVVTNKGHGYASYDYSESKWVNFVELDGITKDDDITIYYWHDIPSDPFLVTKEDFEKADDDN